MSSARRAHPSAPPACSRLLPPPPADLRPLPALSQAAETYVWGQVVVGPPGAGKSTYCTGMQHFLSLAGRRVAVVNLDPGESGGRPSRPLEAPWSCRWARRMRQV